MERIMTDTDGKARGMGNLKQMPRFFADLFQVQNNTCMIRRSLFDLPPVCAFHTLANA